MTYVNKGSRKNQGNKLQIMQRQYQHLSNDEQRQFMAFMMNSPQFNSKPVSDREIYDCIKTALTKLTEGAGLRFEAVNTGILADSFKSVLRLLEVEILDLNYSDRLSFVKKYSATAVGLLVTLDMNLTTANLLKVMKRNHNTILKDVTHEFPY